MSSAAAGVVAAEGVGGDQLPVVEGAATVRELHAVDVPAIAGVVVAEQVERHLREHRCVAAVAADHREGAVADLGSRQRLGQFDLAAVGAITQPHRAGALVAGRRRRTGVDHEATVAGDRGIGSGLRFDPDGGTLGEAGGLATDGGIGVGDAERGKQQLAAAAVTQRPIVPVSVIRLPCSRRPDVCRC